MRFSLSLCMMVLLSACDPAWGISRSLQINKMPDTACAESAIRALPSITVAAPGARVQTLDFSSGTNDLWRISQNDGVIIWERSDIGAGWVPDNTELSMRAAIAVENAVAKQCNVTYSNIRYKCLGGLGLLSQSGQAEHEECRKFLPGLIYLESLDPAIAGIAENDWSGE